MYSSYSTYMTKHSHILGTQTFPNFFKCLERLPNIIYVKTFAHFLIHFLNPSPLARQAMTPCLVGSLRPSASVQRLYSKRNMLCGTLCRSSPYVASNTFTMDNPTLEPTLTLFARVDFIALSGTKNLASVH
jgi:hypothetical protein